MHWDAGEANLASVRRYWVLEALSWIIIAAVLIWKAVLPVLEPPEVTPQLSSESSVLDTQVMRFQGQLILAASSVTQVQGPQGLLQQLKGLEVGSIGQRQRVAVLTGVLCGPSEGMDSLKRLKRMVQDNNVEFSEDQARLNALLTRVFTKGRHGKGSKEDSYGRLSTSDQQFLIDDLGWFGELLVARTQPEGLSTWQSFQASAASTFVFMVVFVIAGALVGFLGLAGLVLGIVWSIKKRLRSLQTGPSGGVFIETFACWLILFLLLSNVIGYATSDTLNPLLGAIVSFFLSLLALCWPTVRRMKWSDSLGQIGLVRGEGWWREILAGVAGYAMMLPILAIGVVGTVLLTMLSKFLSAQRNPFASESTGAHPIIGIFENASVPQVVVVFIAACVAAPIVEEIAFRGILYKALRDMTRRLSVSMSIAIAGLVSGFIFAAIHPQGWVAIPALTAIGFSMALAREWRKSLIAPMVMHAINNSIVLTLLLVLIG